MAGGGGEVGPRKAALKGEWGTEGEGGSERGTLGDFSHCRLPDHPFMQ